MKLPTGIDAVGLTYQVQEVDAMNKTIPRNGETDLQRQIITIDKRLSDDRKKIVLLHEIIHAEAEALGLGDTCDDKNAVQSPAVTLYHTFEHLNPIFSQMIWFGIVRFRQQILNYHCICYPLRFQRPQK